MVDSSSVTLTTSTDTTPTIEGQWESLATGTDPQYVAPNEYVATLNKDGESAKTIIPERISYSPEVNSAKALSLDVRPKSFIEDKTYLGGTVKIDVDGNRLFYGDVKRIDMNQQNESYTLKCYPPGRRLADVSINKTFDNEIIYDTLAGVVDRYNNTDGEMADFRGTGDESLSNVKDVGGGVREGQSGGGTATYSSVGSDITKVEDLYLKIYSASGTVTVDVGTESIDFDSHAQNIYGEWVKIERPNGSGSYDIKVDLPNNGLLIDWIVTIENNLDRNVHTPSVSTTDTNVDIYDYSDLSGKDDTKQADVKYDGGKGAWVTRQVTDWIDNPQNSSDDNSGRWTGQNHVYPDAYNSPTTTGGTFSIEDDFNNWALYVRGEQIPHIRLETQAEHDGTDPDSADSWDNVSSSSTHAYVNSYSTFVDQFDNRFGGGMPNRDDPIPNHWFWAKGHNYKDSGDSGNTEIIAMGIASNAMSDAYGFRVDRGSTTTELVRWDSSSPTVLDSDNSVPPEDSWYSWEIGMADTGGLSGSGDIEVEVDNVATLTANDTNHKNVQSLKVDGGDFYVDNVMMDSTDGKHRREDAQLMVDLSFAGNSENQFEYTESYNNSPHWFKLIDHNWGGNNPITSDVTLDIDVNQTDYNQRWKFDTFVLVHEQSNYSTSDFDNTLTSSHLDKPYQYATPSKFNTQITFQTKRANQNLEASTVTATMDATDGIGNWGLAQVIDGGDTGFPSLTASDSVTNSYSYPGVSHTVRAVLTAQGSTRDNGSPRKGYNPMAIYDYDVDGDLNDLNVLFNEDVRDNRLGVMSTIADEGDAFFRWEGITAQIFKRGDLTTDPDLRDETVESSISIEGAYASVEVIGDGVTSGTVNADNPPSEVTAHKVIEDPSITTKEQATERARTFIENNSSIEYEGSIDTLPTLAPIGEEMNGSIFKHGQNMTIRSVSYRRTNASITLGFERTISDHIVGGAIDTKKLRKYTTS